MCSPQRQQRGARLRSLVTSHRTDMLLFLPSARPSRCGGLVFINAFVSRAPRAPIGPIRSSLHEHYNRGLFALLRAEGKQRRTGNGKDRARPVSFYNRGGRRGSVFQRCRASGRRDREDQGRPVGLRSPARRDAGRSAACCRNAQSPHCVDFANDLFMTTRLRRGNRKREGNPRWLGRTLV